MKSPKDILALGQVIVRQLELASRGAVLERWLAHHLAEVMAEADQAVGAAKAVAEARAVDLILKLWTHRRSLPEPVDPLGGYRNAIAILDRLVPEADPWRRSHRSDTYGDLLHEMFELLTRIVLSGILLTQASRTRAVTTVESEALEEDERLLQSKFERWKRVLSRPPPTPKINVMFVDPEASDPFDIVDDEHDTTDDRAEPDECSFHSSIVSNLVRMQTVLSDLLNRWRGATPCECQDSEKVEER